MIRRILYPALLAACLLSALPAAAFVIAPPGVPGGQDQASLGQSQYQIGFDAGFDQGFGQGLASGTSQCIAQPVDCATRAGQFASRFYGEIEPNDNIVTANPLVLNAYFHGSSYAPQDQDWFYLVTPRQNMTVTVNFSLAHLAAGNLAGWNVSIRNAVGMVFAQFDTGHAALANTLDGMTYPVTLGLAGTYYVVVRPSQNPQNQLQYRLHVTMTEAANTNPNFRVGFFDAEVEPNDTPRQASPIRSGVTMFGLTNLSFSVPIPGDPTYTWGQGEHDWFVYRSPRREIAHLSFCERQRCAEGNWLVQVFDQARIDAVAANPAQFQDVFGNPPDPYDAAALVTFNTTNCGLNACQDPNCVDCVNLDNPATWTFGLNASGNYYIRIGHKRRFDAPCVGYQTDLNNNGLPGDAQGQSARPCFCPGAYRCEIDIPNPLPRVIETRDVWPLCPDGSGGGDNPVCVVNCVMVTANPLTYQTDVDRNGLPGPNPQPCNCFGGAPVCPVTVTNPAPPIAQDIRSFPLCPDGSGGGDEPQCTIGCICTAFGGVVEVPENQVTSQYNFTWMTSPFGSETVNPDGSVDRDAWEDFLNRPNPYR